MICLRYRQKGKTFDFRILEKKYIEKSLQLVVDALVKDDPSVVTN